MNQTCVATQSQDDENSNLLQVAVSRLKEFIDTAPCIEG